MSIAIIDRKQIVHVLYYDVIVETSPTTRV